jgi:hypothetical protein
VGNIHIGQFIISNNGKANADKGIFSGVSEADTTLARLSEIIRI